MKVGILAAGLSKRMGSVNKLLLKINNKTILEHSVINALSYTDDVVVVTGFQREKSEEILKNYPVTVIYNSNYTLGQESSLRCLLNHTHCDILVTLADVPFLSKDDFIKAESNLKNVLSARPFFDNTAGHPVALKKELVELILASDKRVREVIKDYPNSFYPGRKENIVDIDTPNAFMNIDRIYTSPRDFQGEAKIY